MPQAETLAAALSLPTMEGEEIAAEFVFLPEGEHDVHALVDGKPGKRKVKVGPETLEPLQASLARRLSGKVRPFAGYDHKDGKASFIPSAFRYEAGRGVIVQGEWTKSGKEAIAGKDYSYFSPTFHRNKTTGAVMGLLPHGEIGSLVNEPAFESIERIAASHQETDMEITIEEVRASLVKAGALTAEQAEKITKLEEAPEAIKANLEASTKTAVDTAVAEATKDAPEKSDLEKRVAELEGENKTLTESLAAKRAAEADEAITEAVKAGRIPAQDEETKGYWRDQLTNEATAAKAKKELAKLPGAEALKAARVDASKGGEKELTGLARVTAAFSKSN